MTQPTILTIIEMLKEDHEARESIESTLGVDVILYQLKISENVRVAFSDFENGKFGYLFKKGDDE